MGGHVTYSSNFNKYEATIKIENICLQIFLAAREKADGIEGDIRTAYLNAYTDEKIWSVLGEEFEPKLNQRKVKGLMKIFQGPNRKKFLAIVASEELNGK